MIMVKGKSQVFGALLALTLGTLPPVAAQVQSSAPTIPELSVQGHGEIKTKADRAFLTVSVTTESRQEAAAARDDAVKTETLLQAFQRLKIPPGDIQTMSYSVERQFDMTSRIPVLIGFEVTNTVRVQLQDLTQVSRLIDAATTSGATKITDLTYGLSDHQAAENQALAEAVANARSRALAIAAAMHTNLGSLQSVTDSPGSSFQSQNATYFSAGTAGTEATPISPQEITVTADVTVNYALREQPQ